MNKRIEELAIQAGLESVSDNLFYAYNENLEHFAALVRQDEAQACAKHYVDIMRDAIEQAVLREREACAKDRCDAEEEAKRNERYIKEMEQPVPKQSGVMSITVSKVCEADALPPTSNAVYWMDMVVTNLVRNGVNKHRARELAYHFYTYTTPRENNNG